MTERLYFLDCQLLTFTASVKSIRSKDSTHERAAVILDRSAFYPTGGGQPHDTGWLAESRVVEVSEEDANGEVLHWVEGTPRFRAGDEVTGVIDAARRRDHMQQHTGQHILSQAFVKAGNLETKGFHMGSQTSTIDLDWKSPEEAVLETAETLANEVVFSNVPIRIHQVQGEALKQYPIRRHTYDGNLVRVIEIAGFDFSTCGGTHAQQSGEVGLIAILGFERVKQLCRVEFVCGGRALSSLRDLNRVTRTISRLLTTATVATPAKIAQILEENKQAARRIKSLYEVAAEVEASKLLHDAEPLDSVRLVKCIFKQRSLDELRTLAQKTVKGGACVVLLGLEEPDRAQILFARSAESDVAMNDLVKQVAEQFGGRGGGTNLLAQGSIARKEDLSQCLETAAAVLKSRANTKPQ